jgi:hypothetical protein
MPYNERPLGRPEERAMRSLAYLLCFAVGCFGGDELPGGDDCLSDSCVCPTTTACDHACSPGGPPCHVECSPSQTCNVTCEPTEECHVEASTAAAGVDIDCRNTAECHVTCPAAGCTVINCSGDCQVTCGLTGIATKTGTTARCP